MSGYRSMEDSERDQANQRWLFHVLSTSGMDGLHKEYLKQPDDQKEYIRWLVATAMINLNDFWQGLEDEFCDITNILEQITKVE